MDSTDRTVSLEGSPSDVGHAFGAVNRTDIQSEVRAYFGGKDRDRLLAAAEEYRSSVEGLAPHWMEEAAAIAQAAGVAPEEYVAYQGAKYRGINRPECFTWFSTPRRNSGGVTLFHKNRDQQARPQTAYMKHVHAGSRRIYRFLATGDTSDMGVMMGVNETGLAGAADMGHPDPAPRFRGIMNPELLRLVLEQAADVDQARELVRRFHLDRIYAGGRNQTYWMFADRSGRALRIYQAHDALEEKRDEDGVLTMRDDERGIVVMSRLNDARGATTPALMDRLSRTPPVLHRSNLSAMTAIIPASRTDVFVCAEFALYNADRTVYAPLYMGASATPGILMDGTLHRLSVASGERLRPRFEDFESQQAASREGIESAARAALQSGRADECSERLTQGCLQLAEEACRFLSVS